MSWTAPRTWVVGEVLTAALLNVHLRDDMLETATAKVTTAGDIIYATGANALARLGVGSAKNVLQVNTSTNAPTWGPVVPSVGQFAGHASANRHINSGVVIFQTTQADSTVGVTFTVAYASTPNIATSIDNSGSIQARAQSNTGFDMNHQGSSDYKRLGWIADGVT